MLDTWQQIDAYHNHHESPLGRVSPKSTQSEHDRMATGLV